MKIYGIYDTKNNEQCLRVGGLIEVIKFLDLTPREIGRGLKNKNKIRGRYELYFLFDEQVVEN